MNSLEIAAMLQRHIQAVRTLPGFRHAMALIVVECNNSFVADDVYAAVHRLPKKLENFHLLNLMSAYGKKRKADGSPADEQGEMYPGLWTSERNKPVAMRHIRSLLEENRLFLHSRLVSYANRSADFEDTLMYVLSFSLLDGYTVSPTMRTLAKRTHEMYMLLTRERMMYPSS